MTRFFWLAAAVMLTACGSSAPRDPVEALLGLCEDLAAERCSQVERCGAHPAECMNEGCDAPAWQRTAERIEHGRVRFDDQAAAACLRLMHDQCATSHPACADVLVGAVAPGGACGVNGDCAGEAVCLLGETCPGTCVAKPAVGEACAWASDLPCRPDAYCDGGTCVPFAQPGATCNGDVSAGIGVIVGPGEDPELPPAPPPGRVLCDYGLRCVEGRCAETVYSPRPEVGLGDECAGSSPLDRTATCAGDLFCDDRTGRCARPGEEGDGCPETSGSFAVAGELPCAKGLACFAGVCTRMAAPGEPCDGSLDRCPGGLHCIDGTCSLLPHVGEACDPETNFGFACSPDFVDPFDTMQGGTFAWCDPETRTCVATAGYGEACSADADCTGRCVDGRCAGGVCAP